MRITTIQHQAIKKIIVEIAGEDASVILFGSRTDDNKRGGDVDLLIELPNIVDNPAWLIARLSARISRSMEGRRVDVLLTSPNLLKFPIHEHAKSTGILL
jgi:predicted nucleotidyltransferase